MYNIYSLLVLILLSTCWLDSPLEAWVAILLVTTTGEIMFKGILAPTMPTFCYHVRASWVWLFDSQGCFLQERKKEFDDLVLFSWKLRASGKRFKPRSMYPLFVAAGASKNKVLNPILMSAFFKPETSSKLLVASISHTIHWTGIPTYIYYSRSFLFKMYVHVSIHIRSTAMDGKIAEKVTSYRIGP